MLQLKSNTMTGYSRKRSKQDMHYLNADGMVACNPRDREAAHRAEVENIGTENIQLVTCKKCWVVIQKTEKYRNSYK